MKNRFLSSAAILVLAISGTVSVQAQTTEQGPGPSEQPSAPMEMGQGDSAPPPAEQPNGQPSDNGQPMTGENGQPEQPMAEAQPGGPSGTEPAETNQGVGRISMIHGDVSTQRGDSGDWSAAALNQPVLNGDRVSTGAGGRAEVQLDFANILRLGSNAQANIANFTRDHIQIQLGQGLVNYSVFNESEAEPEIDTPNVAIHPAHKDVMLRIEVRPDGDTIIIVRKGEAQISTPQGSTDLHTGEMATVRGASDSAQYKISQSPETDDWDRWNNDRDQMIHSAKSWDHTNKYYTGAEDLDNNGHWQNAEDYGQVWVPNEPQDWAPYRDGNWVWEPYYGWTWVGNEPWGWAPYHYGRWMNYNNAWAWWPGPGWGSPLYRPFWSPAYVGFYGFGGGLGFGVGFGFGGWGGFGWLPLGPCDWFHPWWGGYRGRFGAVNINNIHVTNINRYGGIAPLHSGTRFSNISHINDPHIGHALSTVGAGKFGAGRTTAVAATHEQLSSARMMTGNLPVVPTHASLSASGRAAAASSIHNGGAQHFAGAQGSTRPEPFQQQASHLQQTMQQNHVSSAAAGGRPAGAGVTVSRGGQAPTGKPSAGIASSGRQAAGREAGAGRVTNNATTTNATTNNATNRTAAYRPPSTSNSPRQFAPPNASIQSRQNPQQSPNTQSRTYPQRSMGPASPANRGEQSPATRGEPNRSGWKPFTPPSHTNESASHSGYSPATSARSQSGSYWSRIAPTTNSRSSSSNGYERSGSTSRPTLNMRQPIVQPRSSGSNGGSYHNSPGSSPSYGGSRTPAYSGSHSSAPSYSGSHGSGSSSHSAPSSSGSGSHRGFSGYTSGSHSSASHSYEGGGGHSYGGSSHSYSGGGGGHSYSGGGGHSSGGGGGHSKGGGGGHSGHH